MGSITEVYYPRGYRRMVPTPADSKMPPTIVNTTGDEEVAQLMTDFHTASVDTQSWEYINRVLVTAARLVPDLERFLHHQARNPYVHDIGYEFLEDLVQFITIGRRRTSVMTAIELFEPTLTRRPVHPDRGRYMKRLPGCPLQYWLSHENGVHDMVETLYVFFGPSRVG